MLEGMSLGLTPTPADVFTTTTGRAAFYAAARQIDLEAPHGKAGFWTRLCELGPRVLFVWGRRDTLVRIAFARHIAETLPQARHLEFDCGHVPQVERSRQTHQAVAAFSRSRQRSAPLAIRRLPSSTPRTVDPNAGGGRGHPGPSQRNRTTLSTAIGSP
jgi:hypothetical protein